MSTKGPTSAGVQHTNRGPVQGTQLVGHPMGLPIDAIVDKDGKIRLAVDIGGNFTIDNASITVDIDSASDHIAVRNSTNDNELFIEADGSINIRLQDESGIAYSNANPLPVDIINLPPPSGHTVQIFVENTTAVTTAAYTTILSYTATTSTDHIALAEINGGVDGLARMQLNGTTIRQKRIGSTSPNVEFEFIEPRKLTSSDVITVQFKPDKAVPAFMVGGADFFASIQGFVA